MVRTGMWILAGALVGVGLMLGFQAWKSRERDAQTSDSETPAVPRLAGALASSSAADPAVAGGMPADAATSGVDAAAPSAPAGSSFEPSILPPAVPAIARPEASARPAAGVSQREDGYAFAVARAEEALARGNDRQAVSLLRGLIQQARGNASVDLSEHALKLLALDDDPVSRKQCLIYLQERGRGERAFLDQLAQARILATSEDSAALRRAWDEIHIAYEAALDERARDQVLPILEDYVQRMVFSGRFTPVLTQHAVRPGDTLLGIAVKYGTTVESIQRLNGLSTDVIQPRTRLRVLPGGSGGTKIYVDKSDYRLWLTVDDRVLFHRRVGLGRDNRTPVGSFIVKVKTKDPTWYPGNGQAIPPGDPRNVLGSRWLGFEDTEEVQGIGIHATQNLADIGRESSAGCIRLLTEDMELLFDFVPYKTPVYILE